MTPKSLQNFWVGWTFYSVLSFFVEARSSAAYELRTVSAPNETEKQILALAKQRKFDLAIKKSDDALIKTKSKGRIYFLKAQLEECVDNADQADKDYKRAWQSSELGEVELEWLLWKLHHLSCDETCLAICDRLEKSKTKALKFSARFVKARVLNVLSRRQEAIDEYEHAILLQPRYETTQLECGRLYQLSKQYSKAIAKYSAGLQCSKTKSQQVIRAIGWRGESFFQLRNYQAALLDFNAAHSAAPLERQWLVDRATLYVALKDTAKAKIDFASIKKIDSSY